MRVIPAIDLKDGRCVRLFKGDFDQTTEYSDNPAAVGREFSALAVDNLHIVDLDGARTGDQENRDIVAAITKTSGLDVQLGGGIRDRQSIVNWLATGVSRCVTGSVAIETPTIVMRWIEEFGSDKIVLALDVKIDGDDPMLTTHGWTRMAELSLWDSLDQYVKAGAKHVLCTDVSRDGALAGPNIELYGEILNRYPGIQLQASGGVRDLADLEALRSLGCPAAITGRALLDGAITKPEVAAFQRNA